MRQRNQGYNAQLNFKAPRSFVKLLKGASDALNVAQSEIVREAVPDLLQKLAKKNRKLAQVLKEYERPAA